MKKAFTLSELLITLIILGVVAALTVPSIVHNNQTRINKTRLKKAMATYDRAISQMSVVNRLNNKVLFKQWAEEDNCKNAVSYFNIVNSTMNGCKFKTSDGIWWDVSEIDRTIVSFKEQNLISQKAKDYDDKDAFVLVASFDDTQGVLRIDDLGYETNNPINYSDVYVAKLYDMLGKASEFSEFKKCGAKGQTTCTITVDGKSYTYQKRTLTDYSHGGLCIYDPEKGTTGTGTCNQSSVATAGDYYVAVGGTGTHQEAINNCKAQGAQLTNVAELMLLRNTIPNFYNKWAIERSNQMGGQAYNVWSDGRASRNGRNDKRGYVCIVKI